MESNHPGVLIRHVHAPKVSYQEVIIMNHDPINLNVKEIRDMDQMSLTDGLGIEPKSLTG